MTRTAVVLGGGGLVGEAWEAGVLSAFTARGWDAREADLIVGTSAGSRVASLLRLGLAPEDLYANIVGSALSPRAAGSSIGSVRSLPFPDYPAYGWWLLRGICYASRCVIRGDHGAP